MNALQQEILPASSVEFATSLKLLPSTIPHDVSTSSSDSNANGDTSPTSPTTIRREIVARVLCNVVIARSNILRIFEVREEPALVTATQAYDAEREGKGKTRRGTECVEGDEEIDR